MKNSKVTFNGTNNILFCEPGVHLENCNLVFNASNSLIYLSTNHHIYRVSITVNNSCTCFIDRGCYFNDVVSIICSEEKNVIIGRNALLSFGMWVRTADPHLVYSADTLERINPSKSVYIGDQVWIGQGVMILKGSRIHSGSIIGAGSVLAGKKVPSNVSYAGNPAKQIAENIFWDEHVVHTWTARETKKNQHYAGEPFLFEQTDGETVPFGTIEKKLAKAHSASERLEYITQLADNRSKNRFAWKKAEPPMTLKRRSKLRLKKLILKIMK